MKSQEEQQLTAQIEQARGRLQGFTDELRVVDDEVDSLAPQRTQHELLEQVCGSLDKLDNLGAASLFWGEQADSARIDEQLRAARDRVGTFRAQLDALDERRQEALAKIRREEENLEILGEDLYQLREDEERRKQEWIVERDITPVPHPPQLMAWARGEDDRLFRKSLASSLLVGLLFGVLLPMIDLPMPKAFEPEDVPQRLAQLVRKAHLKPIPPPPVVPDNPQDESPKEEEPVPENEPEPQEQPEQTPSDEPVIAEAESEPLGMPDIPVEAPAVAAVEPQLRQKKVEKAGILAFKDEFASLAKDNVAPKLGSDARFNDAEEESRPSTPTRSMLTTNAPGSSGGINLSSLSRNVGGGGGGDGTGNGGGGGGGIKGVPIGRATSTIASIGGGGRPRAGRGGPGLSRTDEEIQIVFDRYKASFYRLYNRELRKDPTLQGQVVLRLTIEPDGSVSMCMLQSTDMDAPELVEQIVNRVKTINFGAKEGVQALTIVYPIDFLPAA